MTTSATSITEIVTMNAFTTVIAAAVNFYN